MSMSQPEQAQSALSVREAFNLLRNAYRSGDVRQRAEAHLNVVAALADSIESEAQGTEQAGLHQMMLQHAEQSLAAYEKAEFDWGLADARLTRAAVLVDGVSSDADNPQRYAHILQCIDDCYQALQLLQRSPQAPLAMLAQANAMAVAILFQLRQSLADLELPPSLDEWIRAQAETTGEAIAWETRTRSEGNDWLCMARIGSSLVASLPATEDRQSAGRVTSEAAWQAAARLRLTGDQQAAQAAWALYDSSRRATDSEG